MSVQQRVNIGDIAAHEEICHYPAKTGLNHPVHQSQQLAYEPETVGRIIAQAAVLQEAHSQMVSAEQIATIAAEVGIEAEFIQLALQPEFVELALQQPQPKANIFSELRVVLNKIKLYTEARILGVSFVTVVAYGAFATYFFTKTLGTYRYTSNYDLIHFVLPGFLAFLLGVLGRSRRWAVIPGAMLAVVAIAALDLSLRFTTGPVSISAHDIQVFTLMVMSGVLLGVAGAEVRQQVSRRLVRKRHRRTVVRTPSHLADS